jgi:hypothetical protein
MQGFSSNEKLRDLSSSFHLGRIHLVQLQLVHKLEFKVQEFSESETAQHAMLRTEHVLITATGIQ